MNKYSPLSHWGLLTYTKTHWNTVPVTEVCTRERVLLCKSNDSVCTICILNTRQKSRAPFSASVHRCDGWEGQKIDTPISEPPGVQFFLLGSCFYNLLCLFLVSPGFCDTVHESTCLLDMSSKLFTTNWGCMNRKWLSRGIVFVGFVSSNLTFAHVVRVDPLSLC